MVPPRFDAFRRQPSDSVFDETEAKIMPVDTMTYLSERVSVWVRTIFTLNYFYQF